MVVYTGSESLDVDIVDRSGFCCFSFGKIFIGIHFSLSDLDPGEKLKNKGTVLKHTIGLNISSPLNVRWGLNGIVKDLDLTNNSASIGECISK